MKKEKIKTAGMVFFFAAMFFAGRTAAALWTEHVSPAMGKSVLEEAQNWGLGFGEEGTQPTGNVTAEELKKQDAYYVGDAQEKVIYLTFDCGYEGS